MKLTLILFVVAMFNTIFLGFQLGRLVNEERRFPSAEKLVQRDGMIEHPTYGRYPSQVPYEEGMTLYPGQTAVGAVVVPMESTEKESSDAF